MKSESDIDLTPHHYNPDYLEYDSNHPDRYRIDEDERIVADLDSLVNLDAIHHYFTDVEDNDNDYKEPDNTHTWRTAKLIRDLHDGVRKVDSVYNDLEPDYTRIRNLTSFIAGSLASEYDLPQIRKYLENELGNVVFLDASTYDTKKEFGTELPFDFLMDLAHNQKNIIESGLAEDFANDGRGLLKFLNGSATDSFKVGNGPELPKWIIEGRYLADQLIRKPRFQKNFNKVVIFGAHRFITSGELNLNKLYRLFAKLGRINTQLIFVG